MDFNVRQKYPVVRPHVEERDGNNVTITGGLNNYTLDCFSSFENGKYTLRSTGETFDLLSELKKCCLFGRGGVLSAFANRVFWIPIKYEIGRITQVKFKDVKVPNFPDRKLVLIGHPLYAGIPGNSDKYEFLFPVFQYIGENQVNISSSAFDNCPATFRPESDCAFYLAFASDDRAIQLLYKSLMELSLNHANFSIVFLYTAIETAISNFTTNENGKISSKLHEFAVRIKTEFPEEAKLIKKLKRQIEKRIVCRRGEFAHEGRDLTTDNLLESYETALEFFWNYSRFQEISKLLGQK